MKRKVVVKVSTNGQKSRSKALKVVVGVSGVESASLKGQDMDQIEVTGEDIDAVTITKLLRKNIGFAEVVTVAPVEEKKEEKPKEKEKEPEPVPVIWPLYGGLRTMHNRLMNLLVVPSCDLSARNREKNEAGPGELHLGKCIS